MIKTYKLQDLIKKTRKVRGIKTREYRDSGRYPVVDQGSKFIVGYSDDEDSHYKDKLPVVIFGDHTLSVKYIDFEFCVGADGTQILKPNEEIITGKFLYYSILNLNIQPLGYSRHFKLLKEAVFHVPPLEEQKRIVRILDQADALRRKRKEAINLLDEYVQSVFLEMFGDPVTNPKNSKKQMLKDICSKITDGTHQPPPFSDEGIPFLFVRNIMKGYIDFNTKKFINEKTYVDLTRNVRPEKGDILYSTVGSYGKAVFVDTNRKFAFQRHIAHLKPNSDIIDTVFLTAQLNMPLIKAQADKAARGIAQKTVNLADIRKFEVVVPAMRDQKKYTDFYRQKERIRNDMVIQAAEMDNQFNSLMQRAFLNQ